MARRLKSPAAPGRVGSQPVFERVLENGLKVLVLPRPGARIAVCDLLHPVGSCDDPPGKTGLAHFLEHMLFKGTERFPKGSVDQLAFAAGGEANAETDWDHTHYWFSLPADHWELALEIEADRMAAIRLDPREVEAERQVIGEERARDEESALSRLERSHQALSLLRHPYRNPILGWPEDLATIAAEDLEAFHRRGYRPDGAVLVLAGDVDPARVLARAEACFGAIPPGRTRGRGAEAEPLQAGRRDFTIEEPDVQPRAILGWRAAPGGHPDAPALDVLADVLASGRCSRLWRTLVEDRRLAAWVEAGRDAGRREGRFVVQIEAADDRVDPEEVEAAVLEIVDDLIERGPTAEEAARVRRRLEADWRWDQEDLLAVARGVGEAALWGDWRDWQAEYAATLAVDAAAARRAAANHLVDANLTVGWLLRREEGPASSPSPVATPARRGRATGPSPAAATIAGVPPAPPSSRLGPVDFRPRRFTLPNGLRVIHERRPGVGVVAVDLHVEGGWVREARPGAAALTSRMLEEGTASRSARDLAAAIEDVGGSLELGAAWSALRTRSEDLELGLEVLADAARRPAFPAEALEWTKKRLVAELKADREDPAFRAEQEFRRLVYGEHPLARDPRGGVRDLGRLTRDDVVAHHARCFNPEAAFLVVVGEFDTARLRRLVAARFGDWTPSGALMPPWPPLPPRGRPRSRRIACPGEQVHIVMGHRGVARRDPDYDALLILDHVLGSGPGFSDRLGRIVRDEMGLVYSIGGGATDSADVLPGLFQIQAGTMPEEADRVVAAVAEQVRAMHAGDFSDDEVERVKRYLVGSSLFELQTVEQRAERLVELERLGIPLDEPRAQPARLAAVTPGRVRDAARRRLDPEGLFRVELGPIARRGRARRGCASRK